MKKLLYTTLLALLCGTAARAQQHVAQLKVDSMEAVLLSARDTARVNALNLLARRLLYVDQDEAKALRAAGLTNDAYALAQKLRYNRGLANALLNKGIIASWQGNFTGSVSLLQSAIQLLRKENDPYALAACYDFIGGSYQQKGESRTAIPYLDSSRTLYQQLGDTTTSVWSMLTQANAYFSLGEYPDAYRINQQAHDITPVSDTLLRTLILYNLANLYLAVELPEFALEQVNKVLSYYPDRTAQARIKDYWTVMCALVLGGEAHLQLGQVDSAVKISLMVNAPFEQKNVGEHLFRGRLLIALRQYDQALLHLNRALELASGSAQLVLVSSTTRELARAYLGLNDLERAGKYAEQALNTARQVDAQLEMRNAAGTLAEVFDAQKDYSTAYQYSKLHKTLNESLIPEQYKRKLSLVQVQNELALHKHQAQFLAQENSLRQQQLKRESLMKNMAVGGLALFVIMSVIAFRNTSLKRKNEKLRLEHQLQRQELESENTKAKLQQHAAELEMQALRAQMNPHFIFNCLNAINHFILKNETETASGFLTRFSRLIRMVLQSSAHKYISLHDELETLRLYIGLEQVRFRNHFTYELHCHQEVDTESVQIPPMLLQPFVENAIWHGLMHRAEGGRLTIYLREEEGLLCCTIEDNGIGRRRAAELRSKSASYKKSMGMEITANRLQMLGGNGKGYVKIIDLEDEYGEAAGTRVVLRLPVKHAETVTA